MPYFEGRSICIMLVRDVTVRNRAGLHTRPASMIVRTASRFKCEFFIQKDGYEINGKSIIGVMTLAAEQDKRAAIRADIAIGVTGRRV